MRKRDVAFCFTPDKAGCRRAALKFQDLDHFTSDDITAAIERNVPSELKLVPIIVAIVSDDPSAAADVCITLCSHHDTLVRGNAILSLGHLARRFRSLDEALVKPLLERALQDPDEYVRTSAKSAADEIHQFQHWIIAGHKYG